MKTKLLRLTCVILIVLGSSLVTAVPAAAADIDVPGDYSTIQAAIDAASYGDTVLVAAGTYYENIILKHGVVVQGAGAGVTTINGGGVGSVVVANTVGTTTKLDGFTITNGSATFGGGMYNYYSSSTVTNCIFSGNSASDSGGGMCNDIMSSPTVTNCIFIGNSAATCGSGMCNMNGSSPTVTNCCFLNHMIGAYFGGGMCNDNGSWPTVTNCTFSGNWASRGAGMYNDNGSWPTVTNCMFFDNHGYMGGGMYNHDSSPTVTNCTFSDNQANFGGGMYNDSSSLTVTNCILWGNGQEMYHDEYSTLEIEYCDIQGGYSGMGNLNADPLFVKPSANDYHLQTGSPCIDAGWFVLYLPSTDFEGDPRIVDGNGDGTATIDMGADEFVPVNHPPVANDQSVSTDEDTPVNITLTADDADGDPLTYAVVTGPSHGAVSGTAPNCTYTPAINYSGSDNFTFKANDGQADSNIATVSIIINPVNDPPVLTLDPSGDQSIDEGQTLIITATASDPDIGDTLTLSAENLPDGAVFTDHGDGTGTFSWTPGYDQAGTYSGVRFIVTDGIASDFEDITITVNDAAPSVTVRLVDSHGTGIEGGVVKYYSGGWQDFGTTDVNGEVQKSLPLKSYKFRMTYAGAYNDKTQNVGIDPVVVFQTVNVTVQLKDSSGNLIDTGMVKYNAGGWQDFGSTSGGQVSKELLPKKYKFRMTYTDAYNDKTQDVSIDPVVIFQTVNVTVQLQDSAGNLIDTGMVKYNAGGWKDFGTTSGGQVSIELLPKSYKFRMTYAGAYNDKTQNVGSDPVVVFQTGQVVSASGACTHYYAGGWQEFKSGMELLPKTYKFRFNDGTPNTNYIIISGIVNNIH